MSRLDCLKALITAKPLSALAPVADLLLRLYISKVFFLSGLTKIQDWSTTLFLFSNEYHVPVLPPLIAAIGATAGELLLPILLTLGLFTRLSALGLSALNLTAVLSYYYVLKDIPSALQDHLEWGLMLLIIACVPLCRFGLDTLIQRSCHQPPSEMQA
ncbi:DoxX family protein [Deefgea rivuli]|uniref:DoxX family protein n=1 Tax=Deefgea rivuli TaxID=400948 RepID=UPI000688267E|nr:DoxX family protein [Deefgea rivuli]